MAALVPSRGVNESAGSMTRMTIAAEMMCSKTPRSEGFEAVLRCCMSSSPLLFAVHLCKFTQNVGTLVCVLSTLRFSYARRFDGRDMDGRC